MHHLSTYEPQRNEPCLCGSGLKFKKCCLDGYADGANSRAFELFNQGSYPGALKECRRHLTWYILCHKAHTVPFNKAKPAEAAALLTIDVEASDNLVDLLFRCYLRVGIGPEFPKAIEVLAAAIADSRWEDKIRYFRALWTTVEKQDRNGAFRELSAIDLAECRDSKILALYWDSTPEPLGFDESMALLDKIVEYSDCESDRLHYQVTKGIQLCLICEVARGCEIIERAIDHYRSADTSRHSPYGDLQMARGLHILGEFQSDTRLIQAAAISYGDLAASARQAGFPADYLADLTKSLADCSNLLGDFANAEAGYRESLSLHELGLTHVFLARAEVNNGKVNEARQRLKSLDRSDFDDANTYDYALAWSALAATSLEAADLEAARRQLKEVTSRHPFFEQYRQQWLVALLQTTPKHSNDRVTTLLRTINRYLTLNPGLFGCRIDLNKILEDLIEKRSRAGDR